MMKAYIPVPALAPEPAVEYSPLPVNSAFRYVHTPPPSALAAGVTSTSITRITGTTARVPTNTTMTSSSGGGGNWRGAAAVAASELQFEDEDSDQSEYAI